MERTQYEYKSLVTKRAVMNTGRRIRAGTVSRAGEKYTNRDCGASQTQQENILLEDRTAVLYSGGLETQTSSNSKRAAI